MTLFGDKVYAQAIKLRLGLIDCDYDCVLIKGGNLDTETDMHRRKTDTYKPRESLKILQRNQPCQRLDFGILASKTSR